MSFSAKSRASDSDVVPTVFVYNEPGINGKNGLINNEPSWQCCDGVRDVYNENANLLSIVKHLIDNGEKYILNNEIKSFKDPEALRRSLDI